MRLIRGLALLPVTALALACSGREPPQRVDEALNRDLGLAASSMPQQQFVSPAELGYAQGYQQLYGQGYPAPTPAVYRSAPRPSASARTIYRAPEPVRHTKRDAMIGATAGAVTGAVIGRDVKGAVIGAAAGGLLGAVVGHTIDVDKRP
ncbi:MAG: YMGG-like glycine zipper-containing protein [Gemmatimonadota bacterium]|nr:YMGG-like glycine zipper-containing protein [Gemmatimonadota bacterium]